jgi:hypothetical protein
MGPLKMPNIDKLAKSYLPVRGLGYFYKLGYPKALCHNREKDKNPRIYATANAFWACRLG